MGTTPGNRGRFGAFDVLAQAGHWDAVTRAVVLARLTAPGPLVFFAPAEEPGFRALVDRLLAQDGEPRVPVAEMVDERLAAREGDGYRYADMPEDRDAWKRSVAGLDADARDRYGLDLAALDAAEQRAVIEAVRLEPGAWHGMPARRVFALWMRYAAAAFYSHPWAWNEIGFPGPAYPRGYKTLAPDRLEPFEERERDARDPVPWARRVEAARDAHAPAPLPEPSPEPAAEPSPRA